MVGSAGLLEAVSSVDSSGFSTGLEKLDDLVGGLCPGRLWVVTGEPGAGKTTLLTQLAYVLAANHGQSTELFGFSRDGLASYRERIMKLARIGPSHNSVGQSEARTLVPLSVEVGGFVLPSPQAGALQGTCVAIDDPEFKRDPILDPVIRADLRAVADRGAIVLVTAAWHRVCEDYRGRVRLRPEWAETADVILDVVPSQAPDLAKLEIRLNRGRPVGSVAVVRGGDGARFTQVTSAP